MPLKISLEREGLFHPVPEIINQVRELVGIDLHLNMEEIGIIRDISTGSVPQILHDTFDYRKISPRWNLKLPTKELKEKRVSCSQKLLQKYDYCDPRSLYEIVTGNESWIKFTETTRKQQSNSWIPQSSYPLEMPVQTLENLRISRVYFSKLPTRG